MSAVDFDAWAAPELTLTLGGKDGARHTYVIPPPSVGESAQILALAVVAEVELRLVEGDVPDEVQAVVDTIAPDEHPALRDAIVQMRADGLLPMTIDRAAIYAIFFWARGREYADAMATLLFTRLAEKDAATAGAPAPKG